MSHPTQVWAVFRDTQAALAVAQRWPDAELFSAEPIEPLLQIQAPVKTRLGLTMVAGGALGGLLGGALAAATGIWMGLDVGGLPRVPWILIGIITFAISALGAIAAAVTWFLVCGRMLRRKLEMPEKVRRMVADGAVAAMVRVHPEECDAMARELSSAGAGVEVIEVQ